MFYVEVYTPKSWGRVVLEEYDFRLEDDARDYASKLRESLEASGYPGNVRVEVRDQES